MPPDRRTTAVDPPPPPGTVLSLTLGNPVAGGTCLARSDGRVVFVRGGLPGEEVTATVTGYGNGGRFLRAQVDRVVTPSPDRVVPPCAVAGVCGGCDWQHASLDAQRRLKASVIIDALTRTGGLTDIAGIPLGDAVIVAAPDTGDGLGYRTRMRYAVDRAGRIGLRMFNSHAVVEFPGCLLASAPIRHAITTGEHWPAETEVVAASTSSGEVWLSTTGGPHDELHEHVGGRDWTVRATGFWQVHPQAAAVLVDATLDMARPVPGETVLDLYSGVGLFAAFLAEAVGPTGAVVAVEGDLAAVELGKRNVADLPQARFARSDVTKWLASAKRSHTDVVVLDPPRTGAGREVVRAVARRSPRVIIYVACDPVSLARDAKWLSELGYNLAELRCFDIFPMTKHVECVARFSKRQLSD